MHGLASSLLCQQYYQEGLYAAEKHLIFLALETLMHEKRKSIGMLRVCAPQYYPQYYTENNEENNSDKRCPQNKETSIEHARSESSQKKEGTTEKHANEWIAKGKIFRRHSFPNKKTAISNSNMHDILCEEEDASRCKHEENQEENEVDFTQLLTQQLNSKDAAQKQIEETLQETCDVEKMHADALESLVKCLNEDHASNQMKSTATIKQLKCDIAKKNQDMHMKHKKRKEMEEVYESKCKRLELNLKDSKGRIVVVEAESESLQKEIEEVTARNNDLEKEVSNAKKKVQESQACMENAQCELGQWKDKCKEMKNKNKRLEQEQNKLNEKFQQMKRDRELNDFIRPFAQAHVQKENEKRSKATRTRFRSNK